MFTALEIAAAILAVWLIAAAGLAWLVGMSIRIADRHDALYVDDIVESDGTNEPNWWVA